MNGRPFFSLPFSTAATVDYMTFPKTEPAPTTHPLLHLVDSGGNGDDDDDDCSGGGFCVL